PPGYRGRGAAIARAGTGQDQGQRLLLAVPQPGPPCSEGEDLPGAALGASRRRLGIAQGPAHPILRDACGGSGGARRVALIGDVVEDFVAEYAAGRTPNPCLRCNEKIKFAAVLDKALALGFDAVCTGHYARIRDGILHRAADPGKDQSYVLAVLTSEQIAHAMFPLGDTPKAQVRAEAARRGLAVADKPDSHDVCFVADGDTKGFLARHLGSASGPIVDTSGAVLGEHDGAYAFTVGQRRGLRVDTPASDGKPRYVLDIEPVTRTVT